MDNQNTKIAEITSQLAECMDRLESAIRADERARIKDSLYTAWRENGQPVFATGVNTDMHGQPLAAADEAHDLVPLNTNQRRAIAYLKAGWVAVPTLAGNLNIKKQSVHAYLHTLRKHGYRIEKRNTGQRRNGYSAIYRLAS